MLYLTMHGLAADTRVMALKLPKLRLKPRRHQASLYIFIGFALIAGAAIDYQRSQRATLEQPPQVVGLESITQTAAVNRQPDAETALAQLAIKGRAPRTGYARSHFGNGWAKIGGCDTRNRILQRDLTRVTLQPDNCLVRSGTLSDPYTGEVIQFVRGAGTSQMVQIDHVVALSDAWQKGAQLLTRNLREQLSNDPLNLLAVQGQANQNKGDSDAATWLPPNKTYRCTYVARQIAVKYKYSLWVTLAEHDTIARILKSCPNQKLPV